MKGCILGPRIQSDCEKWILDAGKKIFETFSYIPIPDVIIRGDKVFFRNKDLSKLDFIIPRIPRSYMWFGTSVLNLLKGKVYLPIEPESVLISHNKFLTLLFLKEMGLPVPRTYLAISRETLENLLDEMYYPVVMKLLYGSLGKGVMFADSKQSALSVMDTLERLEEPLFLEEYIENRGEDIRVFVLGNDVVGAMKRKARMDERRANIAIGGTGEAIKLKTKHEALAIDAAKALGMSICGIDFITPKNPVIIEANVNVRFEGFVKATGINIAKEIVEFVKREITMERAKASKIERFLEWMRRKSAF